MNRYFATILIATSLLGGCAMNSVKSPWEGRSIDDVTAKMGVPESRVDRADGGATYTYLNIMTDQNGVQVCRQKFVTNSSGKIVSGSHAGCEKFTKVN